ncbi:Guanine nucleotide-binding protein subunit beta-like protein [Hondaea fermentalgiana]|uniref:Guanine nucleotide-binding protein subunit beta-like protein n=1 Tax=Hondaea fermentalgiana TaxID=2315210 RepID=A0A2R5GP15_9STRA|nr:Guanine nucleotide-binding protein subunit beta-like protein [Hondaea fermentalgiana]|eukprot:GBG32620.1 Guanine nucleotide-binding protein subunit beta-like protein [Hondaea fermentalgiana]
MLTAEYLASHGHFEALRELERDAERDLVFFRDNSEDAGEEVDFLRELVLEGKFQDVERSLAVVDGSHQDLFDASRALYCVRRQRLLELVNNDPPPGAKVLRAAFAAARDLNVASAQEINNLRQPIRAVAFGGTGRAAAFGTNGQCIAMTKIPSASTLNAAMSRAEPLAVQGNVHGSALVHGHATETAFPHLTYVEENNPPDLRLQREFLRAKNAHHGSVYALDWAPGNDDLLASGSNDKSVKLWRLREAETAAENSQLDPVLQMHGHKSTVRAVAFVDAQTLASAGGGDNALRLWDISTGKVVALLRGHSSAVFAVDTCSVDRLVSGSGDGTIRCWDPRQREAPCLTLRSPGAQRGIHAIASSAQSPFTLASGHEDGMCRVWDLRAQKTLFQAQTHDDEVRSLSMSKDGRWLLSGSFDGTVGLLDTEAFAQGIVARFQGHRDKVLTVKWLPDRPGFISTSADATAKLWALPEPVRCV